MFSWCQNKITAPNWNLRITSMLALHALTLFMRQPSIPALEPEPLEHIHGDS